MNNKGIAASMIMGISTGFIVHLLIILASSTWREIVGYTCAIVIITMVVVAAIINKRSANLT